MCISRPNHLPPGPCPDGIGPSHHLGGVLHTFGPLVVVLGRAAPRTCPATAPLGHEPLDGPPSKHPVALRAPDVVREAHAVPARIVVVRVPLHIVGAPGPSGEALGAGRPVVVGGGRRPARGEGEAGALGTLPLVVPGGASSRQTWLGVEESFEKVGLVLRGGGGIDIIGGGRRQRQVRGTDVDGGQRRPALAVGHGHQADLGRAISGGIGTGVVIVMVMVMVMARCAVVATRSGIQLVDVLRADLAGGILQGEEGTEMLVHVCVAGFPVGSAIGSGSGSGSIALHRAV